LRRGDTLGTHLVVIAHLESDDSLYGFLWKGGLTAHALLARWAQEVIYAVSGKMRKAGCDLSFVIHELTE
jgi:hypothetical protein